MAWPIKSSHPMRPSSSRAIRLNQATLFPRKFLAVLGNQQLTESTRSSGRLQLVEWLFGADESTACSRVMVNRLWQYHFGKGLVPTANDYGKQGKPPTHPELRRLVSDSFIEDGWSIKAMHRHMMLSRTYRLSSRTSSSQGTEALHATMLAQADSDPNNDWLSAFDRRRIDAESLRDTILWLSGTLDLSPLASIHFRLRPNGSLLSTTVQG